MCAFEAEMRFPNDDPSRNYVAKYLSKLIQLNVENLENPANWQYFLKFVVVWLKPFP